MWSKNLILKYKNKTLNKHNLSTPTNAVRNKAALSCLERRTEKVCSSVSSKASWGLREASFLLQPSDLRLGMRAMAWRHQGDPPAAAARTREPGQQTAWYKPDHPHRDGQHRQASPHVAALRTPGHSSQDHPVSPQASAEGHTLGGDGRSKGSSPLAWGAPTRSQ